MTRTEKEKKEMTGTQENQEKKERRKRNKNNLTEKQMIKENVICSSSCQALLLIFLLLTERCVCRAVIEGKRECNDTKIQIEEQTTTDTRRKVDERKKRRKGR